MAKVEFDDGLVFHKRPVVYDLIVQDRYEYKTVSVASKELGGRVVNKLELAPVVLSERDKDVSPADFSLENLLAVGYDLKHYLMQKDTLTAVKDIENVVKAFGKNLISDENLISENSENNGNSK